MLPLVADGEFNDYCSNCILLSREEQDTQFRQILHRQA